MTLLDIEKSCKAEASIINVDGKNYQELSKNELANLYCDYDEIYNFTKDEQEKDRAALMRSSLWAALLLRYWFKIYQWQKNSTSLGLGLIDFFTWLADSLRDAFYYRSWRKIRWDANTNGWISNPQYVDDENAADKSINYFCGAKRGKEYQAANKDRRKANYQSLSIDTTFDEDGYSILDREGLCNSGGGYNGIKSLINLLLGEDKGIEAVIVDSIAYGDSIKEDKHKHTFMMQELDENGNQTEVEETCYRYSHEFNARKIVKFLSELNEKYFTEYFIKNYDIKDYKPIYEQIKNCSNSKLYKEIEITLNRIKDNPEYLNFLKA